MLIDIWEKLGNILSNFYFGKFLSEVPINSIVFLPCTNTMFCCGVCGLISIKKSLNKDQVKILDLKKQIKTIKLLGYEKCIQKNYKFFNGYLGGEFLLLTLFKQVQSLKKDHLFLEIFLNLKIQEFLCSLAMDLVLVVEQESAMLKCIKELNFFNIIKIVNHRIELLRDIIWCIETELVSNFNKISALILNPMVFLVKSSIIIFRRINTVLNSLDRLEVRGRDSAGISIMFVIDLHLFKNFKVKLVDLGLFDEFENRQFDNLMMNRSIDTTEIVDKNGCLFCVIVITYKVASEVGNLGDNTEFIRNEIKGDIIFQQVVALGDISYTVLSHTRWASIGAVTEPNCHPVDSVTKKISFNKNRIIHVCLNGEIDNYVELKKKCELSGEIIPCKITTDAKIIPLMVEKYMVECGDIIEAFRLSVNDFRGSHAIVMQTDYAPDKLFIAHKGSGQAMFVGLAENYYVVSSEVYGFIEETNKFLRIKGDRIINSVLGNIQGQILVLDRYSKFEIISMSYDGTPLVSSKNDVMYTNITSRDIDRKGYPHYFLKEIYQSPLSVENTLLNKWKTDLVKNKCYYSVKVDSMTLSVELQEAFESGKICRIFFIGQGTSGVAARACFNIFKYYLKESDLYIANFMASEFSGFEIIDEYDNLSLSDTLVVAISQSGTTADTNRAIDMAKCMGAYTLCIVNRRDSDLTFKVDGVMYTSTGRDVEMSVASTKAFYSQVVAGAVLGLQIAYLKNSRSRMFISNELAELFKLPDHMRKILSMEKNIRMSARKLAVRKKYWATVGSGSNKASADEIRIKLSELCYKTISSDYIEDKKHIDLSSEPLIIVCAAGSSEVILNDIVKDVAIFKAHKATPVVIADEGDFRFEMYADDVFYVEKVPPYLSPILNTLVGHVWGYHAALAINESSSLLYQFRETIQKEIDFYLSIGLDLFELIRRKSFRGKIVRFYKEFRLRSNRSQFLICGKSHVDFALVLKYLSWDLPISNFEIDFFVKGTAKNMLNCLFIVLNKSIDEMSRPIDAIRHQAKTVTVGTSRVGNKIGDSCLKS